ncbi:MAG: hypothetical protein LQ346_001916 [Caloplaca aetnensis]|nr:MAG: hypothetical protein LQ346_001916 [Caloplaca aetnensis]
MILTGVDRIHGFGSTKGLSGAPPSLDDDNGDGIGSRSDLKVPTQSLFSLREKQNTSKTVNVQYQRANKTRRTNLPRVNAMSSQATRKVRQQQTLDQLASMQLDDEPGILRLRQPLVDAVAELGTDPPRPAELAGSSFHNDGGPTASGACRSSSSPPSAALEEESAVTTTPPKVPLKCSDRRISAPNMPWAHDDPSTSQRDRLTTLNDTRSRSYIYPSTSNPQEPQPRDNQNRHSTSILAGAHNSSPALTSPAAIPPRSSTTDTEKEPAGYSCFDELDRLVKQLPPRTPRRHLHPDVI